MVGEQLLVSFGFALGVSGLCLQSENLTCPKPRGVKTNRIEIEKCFIHPPVGEIKNK